VHSGMLLQSPLEQEECISSLLLSALNVLHAQSSRVVHSQLAETKLLVVQHVGVVLDDQLAELS